jgi:hypothetical protein
MSTNTPKQPLFAAHPTFDPKDAWVLLWSRSQCALHVEPVADMLKENRSAYADDRRMDYVPIHIGTKQECHDLARAIRNTMRTRQKQKASCS